MKLFENISNGYKKIASGIAIVAFLTMLYFALIPGGSLAGPSSVTAISGDPIVGAFVKVVEWPQYNATTDVNGNYSINNVPYDATTGSTYTLRISALGYGSNTTSVTLTQSAPNPAVSMDLYPSEPKYMPYLDDRGTSTESFIVIFNPFNFNTTEDVTVYNVLTGINSTSTYEIPVNTSDIRIAEILSGGNFVGTVKVGNTRPESLVQGYIKSMSVGSYSAALSRKIPVENISYIPYLDDRGTSTDSGIQVFNPYDFNITADLTAFNALTGLNNTLSFEIPAKSFGSRYAADVAGGAVGSNVDFVGTVKVKTSQPAPVQGNLRSLSKSVSSIAPSATIPSVNVSYLPYLDDRGTSTDSGIQVFNPYDFNITADLTAFNALTGLNNTLSFEIPAKSFGSRYAADVAGGAVGSNVDFVGTVKVQTSQPALVQGNLRSRSYMISSLTSAIVVPSTNIQNILYLNHTGTQYDSGIQIFNPYDFNITADMTGYNLYNGLKTTLSFEIPAKSFSSKYAKDVAGGVDFMGTVNVKTSQPVPVQGNIRERTYMISGLIPAVILQ